MIWFGSRPTRWVRRAASPLDVVSRDARRRNTEIRRLAPLSEPPRARQPRQHEGL